MVKKNFSGGMGQLKSIKQKQNKKERHLDESGKKVEGMSNKSRIWDVPVETFDKLAPPSNPVLLRRYDFLIPTIKPSITAIVSWHSQ